MQVVLSIHKLSNKFQYFDSGIDFYRSIFILKQLQKLKSLIFKWITIRNYFKLSI